ncbi:MAG: hypothetical protein IIY92_01710 [Lachnospiraceae bacterium]|nr:hypothetical protein [Lachnospiraceae bacterium]
MTGKEMVRPVSDRIAEIKRHFKEVEYHDMWLDAERTQIITDSYKKYEADFPTVKRAKFFRDLAEKMTVRVEDYELIVGHQGRSYRAITPYVEWGAKPLLDAVNMDDETFHITYQTDGCRNLMTDEDREVFRETAPFWIGRSVGEHNSAVVPEAAWKLGDSGCFTVRPPIMGPICEGHFCANFDKMVHKGANAIRQEALDRMAELEGRCYGQDAAKYIFWRAVSIAMEGACLLNDRVLCFKKSSPVL